MAYGKWRIPKFKCVNSYQSLSCQLESSNVFYTLILISCCSGSKYEQTIWNHIIWQVLLRTIVNTWRLGCRDLAIRHKIGAKMSIADFGFMPVSARCLSLSVFCGFPVRRSRSARTTWTAFQTCFAKNLRYVDGLNQRGLRVVVHAVA